MPNPTTRDDSSLIQFRIKVPADVRDRAKGRMILVELPAMGSDDAVTVTARIGEHVKLSLRTRDPQVAKARHGAALAHVQRVFDGLRSGPKALSLRQIVALSGDVYRLFLDECGDEPGEVDNWIALKGFNRAVREGRIAPPLPFSQTPDLGMRPRSPLQVFGVALSAGIDGRPIGTPEVEALEARFGLLANWTLMRQGVEVGPDDRVKLLKAVEEATTVAAVVLKRHARMDFTPASEVEARFPVFVAPEPVQPSVTLTAIFDRWRAEANPAPRTLVNWRSVLRRFKAFVDHEDASRVTPEDVIAYKDRLISDGVAVRTVAAAWRRP